MKKKVKFNDLQQANIQIMQKKNQPKQVIDDGPLGNFVVERGGGQVDMFKSSQPQRGIEIQLMIEDNGQPLMRRPTFEPGPQNP